MLHQTLYDACSQLADYAGDKALMEDVAQLRCAHDRYEYEDFIRLCVMLAPNLQIMLETKLDGGCSRLCRRQSLMEDVAQSNVLMIDTEYEGFIRLCVMLAPNMQIMPEAKLDGGF
ncbi:hypothetical protein KP509_29G019600 [Ceratopteris richardii]|uniref:Uncharacterized protein n=1 Tax=Ceratopteris richardii TaxID=49495 RepID=A0A8T2R583_CERRI|nr:hypothetical protein KP509_29G019600 [Ceratopteris richardii]